MRASEFIFNEGKASRRKQASMNAKRRMANAQPQTTAPAAQPTASTGTSAPASVATRPNPYMTPQANVPNVPIDPAQPTASTGTSAPAVAPGVSTAPVVAQPQSTTPPNATVGRVNVAKPNNPNQAYATQPASTNGTANLNTATALTPPAPAKQSAGSSMMGALKSAGKGIANKFSKQGQISARTDKIFMDKFIKDMGTAEQTSTGLRGEPFDVKTWVDKYLAQNKWSAGDQHAPLYKAVAANYKPGIAKAMAAIGKNNNLGSTMKAQGAMDNMAGQLTNPSGAGTASTTNVASPTNPNQTPATQTTAPTTPAVQVSLGGKLGQPNTLNPADPVDAKILSMLKQQGKI